MKYAFLMIVLLIINFGCSQSASRPITEFSQNDLESGILIDVRTPEEYQQGHIKNALNINLMNPNFEKQVQNLDKEKTIYVYCKKGGRSAKAFDKLKTLGFKNVIDLEGGYDAWSEKK